MKKYDYVGKWFVNEIIKIGEQNGYKYVLLWAEKFYEKLYRTHDLISIELIKNELPKYYRAMVN